MKPVLLCLPVFFASAGLGWSTDEPPDDKPAPAAEKATKPVVQPTADKINAFFLTGIAHDKTIHTTNAKGKPKTEIKKGVNRIYQVSEITAKFGDPAAIKEGKIGTGSLSVALPPVLKKSSTHDVQTENWTWKCEDGEITVRFLLVGYGKEGDPKTKRLFIYDKPRMKK